SVSASSASRNPSPEALSLSSSRESEKESVGSDSKTPTSPRVITGKLSSKRLPPLKLPAAFPEGKASTMSWDNQIAAKEGNNMVSRAENIPKSIQLPQAPILGLLNMIHGSAELSSYLGNQNITHNNELWNSEHHALSLSGYSEHLETDTMSGAVHTRVEVHRMDLWNNLGFSLCAAPSVCRVVATSDEGEGVQVGVSADWCVAVEH
ncbi:hypothetical protein Ac2012v2_008029, partial [Leucoagaricus gongylophorus]